MQSLVSYQKVALDKVATKEVGTLVYTVGVVLEEGKVMERPSRGPPGSPPVNLKELQIATPATTLTLSLWGPLANMSPGEALQGRVLAVNRARVREFQGVKNLSLSPPGYYEVDQNNAEVKALASWALEHHGLGGLPLMKGQVKAATPAQVKLLPYLVCSLNLHLIPRFRLSPQPLHKLTTLNSSPSRWSPQLQHR